MDSLSGNLVTYLSEFLDIKSIVRLSQTSKSIMELVLDKAYWNYRLSSYTIPNLTQQSNSLSDIRPLVAQFEPYLQYHARVEDPFKVYTSASRSLKEIRPMIAEGIDQSSYDYDQDIRKVLTLQDESFWSSRGSLTTDANEYLTFRLKAPAIIFAVQIKVYLARFQGGRLYPPQRISFQIGATPEVDNYTSPEFEVSRHENPQQFFLLPNIVVGEYIRLNLLGKVLTQEEDNKYYTVLNHVEVFGAPLIALNWEELTAGLELKDIDEDQVQKLLNQKKWGAARKLMLKDANLATIYNLMLLQEGNQKSLTKYLLDVKGKRRLNAHETYLYVEQIEPTPSITQDSHWNFTHSEALGDLYYSLGMYHDAIQIYNGCQFVEKIVKCLFYLKDFNKVKYISDHYTLIDAETILKAADEVGEDVRKAYVAFLEEQSN